MHISKKKIHILFFQRINRIRKISTDGKISTFAGKDSKCNCLDAACKCFEQDQFLAANVKFSAVSSISCAPDGVLYIADQGNYRIRAVSSSIPPEKSDGVFEVPDPETQEVYIFNKFGQHVLTKDLMTSNVLYKMTYTQTTSNGKLSSITDSSQRKVTVQRDYKGQVNALQTSNGLKYTLKMSRVGDLESFQTPSKMTVNFKYLRSSGLLKSKWDESLNTAYIYEYDQYGRLVNAISPTGEATSLTFNLTSLGAAIEVKKNAKTSKVLRIQDDQVTASSGRRSNVISIAADKTLTGQTSWSQSSTLATIPHPVIAASSDLVMGDSFPMVAEQRSYMGSNLVNKLDWEYNLATNGHNGQMMGIRKTMRVNGENLLTMYFDKLQRREVVYAGTKTELLEIRYDSLSRPIQWEPKAGGFVTLLQSYDRFGHMQEWSRGDVVERYDYDKSGRISAISLGNVTQLKYGYPDAFQILPNAVTTGSPGGKSKFSLDYDEKTGGLTRIQTPRGHFHSFRLRPAVGSLRFQYLSPWSENRYELLFNSEGNILQKRLPSNGNERISYVYDDFGQLDQMICGDFESEFSYDEETGTLDTVLIRKGHSFDMKLRNKYHSGLLKEQKVRFTGGYPPLDNAIFRYQYDGNGRPSSSVINIGNQQDQQQSWTCTYNSNTGQVESLGNLRVNRLAHNKTVLQDINNNYFKTISLDGNGRIEELSYGLRRKEMLSLRFGYNKQNKMRKKSSRNHEGRPSEENYSYTPDGHLLKVWGPDNFDMKYDANGNLIGMGDASGVVNLQYDAGDRVEKRDGKTRIIYDGNGCIRQVGDKIKFWHDAQGRLDEVILFKNGGMIRVSFRYDHLGRLVSQYDSSGQVRQFFYANPMDDFQLTHAHNPKSGLSQRLLYDHMGHLVAIESSATRGQSVLIATDHLGSPLLVFKPDGSIVKEIKYSPFGQIMEDTNPGLSIPLGFQGSILLSNVPLVYMPRERRMYHPDLVQFLNPDWEALHGQITNPLQLFVYRFHNNDPINHVDHQDLEYMTSAESWTKQFALDMDKILDASKKNLDTINHLNTLGHKITPDQQLISGLGNTLSNAQRSVASINFVRGYSPVSQSRQLILNKRVSSQPMSFGNGFLLSVLDRVSVVNIIEGVPGVIQNIFESVLNGSYFLDVSYMVTADKSIFYFAKPDVDKFRIDMDNVNRLAGEFNVDVRDLDKGDKDLKIQNKNLILHVIYGKGFNHHR